jgi:hypothetical protein
MYKAGFRKYRDAMSGSRFITALEAEKRYGLKREEFGIWDASVQPYRL